MNTGLLNWLATAPLLVCSVAFFTGAAAIAYGNMQPALARVRTPDENAK